MKQKFTLIIAAFVFAGLYSSCKKDAVTAEKKEVAKLDKAVLARQMVTDLQKTFSNEVGPGKQLNSTLKTANVGCPLPMQYNYNTTVTRGDTTEDYTRYNLYNQLCDGNGKVYAFTFNDTSRTVQRGTGFVNTYRSTYYHHAQGPDWRAMVVAGRSTNGQNLRKVRPDGTTYEFHDLNTSYTYNTMIVDAFAEGNKFVSGKIDFAVQTVDLSPEIPTGIFSGYNGFIYYINNTARIYFRDSNSQGGYIRYIHDFSTHQMTGPVNSYPFPVDMN